MLAPWVRTTALIRRLRTLTFGFLTPFYFIRAGSFVSVPALLAAPVVLLVLFSAKMLTKIVAVFPAVRFHKYEGTAGIYYTLMMSTGLDLRHDIGALWAEPQNIGDALLLGSCLTASRCSNPDLKQLKRIEPLDSLLHWSV